MGAGQSTEKKSPTKEVNEAVNENPSPKKDVKTPSKQGDRAAANKADVTTPEKLDVEITEEDVATVEAAAKKMRDTVGGTSLEIVLSPAIKKVIIPTLVLRILCRKYMFLFLPLALLSVKKRSYLILSFD